MIALIFLIFFSKLSFRFIPGVPYEVFPVVFQYGIHPYINIMFCLIGGGLLMLNRRYRIPIYKQYKLYDLFLVVFCLYLLTITCFQILFGSESPALMSLAACIMSVFTIFFFGKWIPTHLDRATFLKYVKLFSFALSWISLFLFFVSPGTSFHGGRFIGFFKHIPHMVSIATFCSVFSLYDIFSSEAKTRTRLILSYLHFFLGIYLLILTGTRSALGSVFLALILALLLYRSLRPAIRFLKTALACTLLLVGVLFGADIAEYAIQVTRGERAVGYRAAQDGVSSRWDEIVRGYSAFQEEPWLGYGILSKFGQDADGNVGNYNANKDPHNLLISAGVVGGYGLIVIITFGFLGLCAMSLYKLRSKDEVTKILAIYLVTQLPIIFIYHIHISMGGIADRVYWIVIGYLATKEAFSYTKSAQ